MRSVATHVIPTEMRTYLLSTVLVCVGMVAGFLLAENIVGIIPVAICKPTTIKEVFLTKATNTVTSQEYATSVKATFFSDSTVVFERSMDGSQTELSLKTSFRVAKDGTYVYDTFGGQVYIQKDSLVFGTTDSNGHLFILH